jgi:hypothetical protein
MSRNLVLQASGEEHTTRRGHKREDIASLDVSVDHAHLVMQMGQ